jgi:hypothetical protein
VQNAWWTMPEPGSRAFSISSPIGPPRRCQVDVMETLADSPPRAMHMPIADSRISVSISSTSSRRSVGTWGPRTDVGEAARMDTSEPVA